MCTVKKIFKPIFTPSLKNEKRYRKIFSGFKTYEKRLLRDNLSTFIIFLGLKGLSNGTVIIFKQIQIFCPKTLPDPINIVRVYSLVKS